MKVKAVAIDSLRLDDSNARKHSERNLAAIKESLSRFGQRKPIAVRGTKVLAGNGTLEAARQLGWTEIQVVEVPDDWDEDTAKAYALADNRTAELAEWDEAELAKQLLELEDAEWDIEALGFELPKLHDVDVDEDEIPEPPVEPITKVGDIWQLGNIQIICQDVRHLKMPECNWIISDPPYGMQVDFSWYGGVVGKSLGGERKIKSKHSELNKPEWDQEKFNPEHLLQHQKQAALFGANYYYEFLPPDGTWWIWDKRTTSAGEIQNAYGMPYEMIWLAGKHKSNIIRHLWAGFTRKAEKADKERLHPTQKPIAVMRELVEYLTTPDDVILDPYAGSGSTLVACLQLNRRAIGVEINPLYVDVIVNRLQSMTGQTATLLTKE